MERDIELEEGCEIVQRGITKVINIIEGVPDESPMDAEYWMNLYTTVYTMGPPSRRDYSKELYERYEGVFNDYLRSKVLPAIQEKDDDISILQEFVKRWANHKVMVTKLGRFFHTLDRFYIRRSSLPSLKEVGFGCFLEIAYGKMKVKVRDVVIALINQERQGNEINGSLVKDVLEIFVKIGNENYSDYYVDDFEIAFLTDTAGYYTRKGFIGISVAECLKMEKEMVSCYLPSGTVGKLLKIVQGLGKEMTLSDDKLT
ncbi:hypothetical protein C5167_043577 [Papaver somniferum]|uniref:Cullin N-terminal domain-containing protein n=1 Tax=Papaver somniferum TaxID=3469 RepID=A0A4Y7L7S9_PAPSO|nr:putative cullin-like protein 2 [Papaver somniferum]RZC80997.1 hypothetical protein C5167_043577 [Papaver somniferum]